MRLVRTFHPVGHGAFYTEKFYLEEADSSPLSSVVYDCGCFETAKSQNSIKSYQKRIIDLIDGSFSNNETIDALFISHLHTDHILGVDYLLKHCKVKRIILPLLSEEDNLAMLINNILDLFPDDSDETDPNDGSVLDMVINCWSAIQSFENKTFVRPFEENNVIQDRTVSLEEITNEIDSGTRIQTPSIGPFHWEYIPFNSPVKESKANDLKNRLVKLIPSLYSTNGKLNSEELKKYLCSNGIFTIKKEYKSVFPMENEYSMTLLSGLPEKCRKTCERSCEKTEATIRRYCTLNCLYMGDYELNKGDYWSVLWKCYKKLFKYIGLVQVPHHGSENNYNDKFYERPLSNGEKALSKICIISAGKDDKYNHPDQVVLDSIQGHNCVPIIVTEDPKTIQKFTYVLRD